MVVQMIAVGEDSGSLEIMLSKVADFYDQEVQAATEQLTALIEPLMIAFIGVVIGGMIVALYMPVFRSSRSSSSRRTCSHMPSTGMCVLARPIMRTDPRELGSRYSRAFTPVRGILPVNMPPIASQVTAPSSSLHHSLH